MPTLQTHAPRWRRKPAVRPHQILDAAFRVFGDKGLHRATLDDVARAAGITKGTIYLYFPSKAALFAAMLKARVTALMPLAEGASGPAAGSTRERMTRFGRLIYRFFRSPQYLNMFRAVVSEAAEFPDEAALLYRDWVLHANRRLADVLRAGIAAGELRHVDTLVAARAFIGMFMIFAISQALLGGQRILPLSDRRVVETVAEVFFQGVARPAARNADAHRPAGAPRIARSARRDA
jgi:AcrR family transcriptional regulator